MTDSVWNTSGRLVAVIAFMITILFFFSYFSIVLRCSHVIPNVKFIRLTKKKEKSNQIKFNWWHTIFLINVSATIQSNEKTHTNNVWYSSSLKVQKCTFHLFGPMNDCNEIIFNILRCRQIYSILIEKFDLHEFRAYTFACKLVHSLGNCVKESC